MTSVSSLATHSLSQPTSVTACEPEPVTLRTNGILSLDGVVEEEEPYTIKCVCGYHDDDGNTVLCESCNTWQHIECYYPAVRVPEIHACVDCDPRPVDAKQAAERQRRLREGHTLGDRKVKRAAPKNHKRKIKDQAHAVVGLTNGWPVPDNATAGHDRKSGSPRNQQAPAKRPKNAHRPSGSTSSHMNNPSLAPTARKRAESSAQLRQSPTKSPSTPDPNGFFAPLYSPEFVQFHVARSNFQLIDVNSYHNIGVTSSLSTWLKDPVALANVTNGKQKAEVFQSYDKPFEELLAPNLTKHFGEDAAVSVHGMHPVWHWLTIDEPRPSGAFIGELKGQIGRKEDYIDDPSNRWATLRHPEPFVFFPRHLPIYIDTRFEGTMLRYVRRSCQPNLKMTIIITEGLNYHFCFIAQKDIAQDEEITIGWELDEEIQGVLTASLSNGNIKKEGFQVAEEQYISNWVSGVLANFGGCACDRSLGTCLMDRFVRYHGPPSIEANSHQAKQPKTRRRKAGDQVSPLSTGHATNSRANSEAFTQGDQEDDNGDSRSATSSSRSKPASRDMTPMTHASTEGPTTMGLEMSDREKKKLLQQEKLFEQLAHDEQHGNKRRKRGSGSTLTTPTLPTAKQLLDPSAYPAKSPANTSNPRPGLDSSQSYFSSIPGQKPSAARLPPPWPGTPLAVQSALTRPTYSESSTQTGNDAGPVLNRTVSLKRKRHVSFTQRMLQRCHDQRIKREEQRPPEEPKPDNEAQQDEARKVESYSVEVSARTDMPPPVGLGVSAAPPQDGPAPPSESEDVQMQDVSTDIPAASSEPTIPQPPPEPVPASEVQSSHPPIQPPAPPWEQPDELPPPEPVVARAKSRTPSLHVQLPPAPRFSSPSPTTSSASATSASITGGPLAQSPLSATNQPPLFSPTVAGVVTPSPAKKRISFSDYLSRKSSAAAQTHSVSSVTSSTAPQARSSTSSTTGPTQPAVPTSSIPPNPPILRPSSSLVNEIKVPEELRSASDLEALSRANGDEQPINGAMQEDKPA